MKFKTLLILLIIPLILGACGGGPTGPPLKPMTITYWRVFDETDNFREIIKKYNAIHPYISIKYRKLRSDEYEQALLEAFATDRGPDIFSIHNTWLGKYKEMELIEPLPEQITMVYPVVTGSVKKEVIQELRTEKTLSIRELESNFVDVVYDDVVIERDDGKTKKDMIYGLPLSVDTLAMFYNKDLFNNAGLTGPSEFWNRQFQQDVKKLTKQDSKGEIIQSGVALGGSENIDRFSDILSVLMMQNGTEMMTGRDRTTFHATPEGFKDKNYNPGLEALRFYTDFANPGKEVYSWNDNLDNSLSMFADGKLAMMFGYSYHLPMIKIKNPKLNFSISSLPQIDGNAQNINFANYWTEVVSSKSKNIDEAWDFVQFMTKKENVKSYLESTGKPTALRALINEQVDDFDIGVFVDQILTSKSWYKGVNVRAAEQYLGEMVEAVVVKQEEVETAISAGAKKVQQTMFLK